LAAYLEKRIIYLYNICSFDMRIWHLFFVVQWILVTLQLMRFLSNAYINYNWNSDVARVAMAIADFVTEIPFVTPFTAYIITAALCSWYILYAIFCAVSHHSAEWVVPLKWMRIMLMWFPVVYFPVLIPHLKMVLPCFSYTPDSFTQHPFYEDLTCWGSNHGGFFVLSLIIATLAFSIQYFTTVFFTNTEMPSGLSLREHAYNAAFLIAKTVLLILYIGGHTNSWRYALSIMTTLCGVGAAVHLLWAMPWWHDTALLLHIFQAFILAWTGFTALLMTALDDTAGTGMLYFVMLPVLLIGAQMALQWRVRVIGALSDRELTSGTLVITKIRYYARTYFQWLAQFGDIYLENNDGQMRELGICLSLVEDTLEMAVERFPEHTDLHIYTTQYYLTISRNRVLAYRSLNLAESSPHLTLEQRFNCQAIRHVLNEATMKEQSEEVRNYTEFKSRRVVSFMLFYSHS